MVPVREDASVTNSGFSFSLIKSLLPVEKERQNAQIEVSSFGGCFNQKSPGVISNFSTSKWTKGNKASSQSKYQFEVEEESDSSSDEWLSYENGHSENAYSDIYIPNMSKQSLANLRRKSAYLTRAPMKPLSSSQFDKEDDSEDSGEEGSPIYLKVTKCKNTKRMTTLKVQPFKC